jgi:hypothetical protein
MQLFRHLGLMIAVFWCAAMVVAPITAAGAGQDMNQAPGSQGMNSGQGNLGYHQMQPGQAGNTMDMQGNGQNNAGPGQGNRSQGLDRGNMTEFGNHTRIAPDDGNLTAPPEKPDRDPDNSTALNKTGHHGPWDGNLTGANMTEIPPHMDWDPANMTAVNQTGHGHSDGNLTPPAQPHQQNGADGGRQGNENQQQVQTQTISSDSLMAELVDWLKAHGIS